MKSKVLFFIAIIGFLLSLFAHISSFLGVNPEEVFPLVWVLHMGFFIMFIPAVSHLKKNKGNGKDIFLGIQFAPVWMKGFSGHWMILYLFLATVVYSKRHEHLQKNI